MEITDSDLSSPTILSRSHWNCTKHVAALKLYKNKLVILNAAIFYVSMSPRLLSQTFKHKLGSEVKISGKQTPSKKFFFFFSKLKCRQFLYKIFSLYILSASYTSKNMLGIKNEGTVEFSKQVKKPAKSHIF